MLLNELNSGMVRLLRIMSISLIALGMTLLAIIADRLLRIGLGGLLSEGSDSTHLLLILRSLECLLLILILLERELPKISLRPISIDLALGTFFVFGGWSGSLIIDAWLESSGHPPVFSPLKAGREFSWSFLVLAVFAGPLLEELFFRAGLHRSCSPKGGLENALVLILSSMLFACLHLDWSQTLGQQLPFLFMWSCCGLLTMGLYMLRRSLLPGLLLHGGANAILFFL